MGEEFKRYHGRWDFVCMKSGSLKAAGMKTVKSLAKRKTHINTYLGNIY